MSDFILHHYPMSPFSEKIRAMLGFTNTAWCSVETTPMPPRPTLLKLVGGYRKIPVAQIGADLFCDTRTIATELATLSGQPRLALENCEDEIQTFVIDVELRTFFACIMAGGTRTLRQKVRASMSWPDIARLVWDRLQMSRKSTITMNGFHGARIKVLRHLSTMEEHLGQAFLFGTAPTHGDFAAYPGLWFLCDLAESPLLQAFPKTNAWLDRMSAFGHGTVTDMSPMQALQAAQMSQPRRIDPADQQDPLIGQQVRIAPSDYGLTPTAGTLVGRTATAWILARTEPELGTVHVHFPIIGYAITPLTTPSRQV